MSIAAAGHIKLARKAFDADQGDPFWHEHRVFSRWEAWVYVLQLAAFSARRYQTKHGPVDLERGEFVASLRTLAAHFKWNLKSVRTWVATCQKGARMKAQRETPAGTVYLIVNYDAYQSAGHSKGTAEGTAEGTDGAQQGHKREAGKAGKAVKASAGAVIAIVEPPPPGPLPVPVCNPAYEAYCRLVGSVEYPRFRKALLPIYKSPTADHPTAEQLIGGIEAFAEAREASDPRFIGSYTVEKFAQALHYYVRLGAMPLMNEWGEPTERGIAARILA